jgi:hypothetical protein
MKEIKLLTKENIPCWYELSWRKTKPAIILRVHKDFIKGSKIIPDDNWMVVDFKKQFSFSNFIGNFDGNFGFDNVFIRRGEKKEFVEFVVEIPRIRQKTDKSCPHCNGSGRDDFFKRKCDRCKGTGTEHIDDWKPAYAVSASFTVFFTFSFHPGEETSSSLIQLMIVRTVTHGDMHGGSIGGEFSVPLCNWMDSLREKGESNIVEMVEAMQITHRQIWGILEPYRKYYFRASVDYEGGWLNTSCPGNACGLNPVHMGPRKGQGYEFSCHNVDSPAQQLELIASLAALHDKARKEIKT